MINMIICHTTIGHYSIQEHIDDASEIGYGFSTLPKFQVEIKVKVELNWKLTNAAEKAAYLQFLRDYRKDWFF